MAETVKCVCNHCGAKYRLPVEYQGRTARCKKCNEKFQIPAEKSVEDSVLDWLSEAAEEADEPVEQPKVRSMVESTGSGGSGSSMVPADAKKPIIRRKES